jgi:outer membrane protein assembly factor BamC
MTHLLRSLFTAALALVFAAGCSNSVLPTKKVDYKSATQAAPLELPPDLPVPNTSDRFALPEAPGRTTATYSEYSQDRPARAQASGVLPAVEGARIARAGTQRWLVVSAKPEDVWPVLRDFWQQQGFVIASDEPDLGLMETDWAENRAKIPQSVIRNLIGKIYDQAYSSPELDRFKTRVERGSQPNTTEIYISHRGAYEMYVADANLRQTGRTVWQPRQPDPNLEAEMLSRLMVRFGTSDAVATAAVKETRLEPRAKLSTSPEGQTVLVLQDDFDRAWRRVGLSLDRLGFAVQDRDRDAGLYFVRYLSPPAPTKEETGLVSRLAFWRKRESEGGKEGDYRVALSEAGDATQVKVLGADGTPDGSEAAGRMLAVLQEDLR